MKSLRLALAGSIALFSLCAVAATDTSNKGTLTANAAYDWNSGSAAIDTYWSLDSSDFIWGINNDAYRYKLCWKKVGQVGDACWYSKEYYSEYTLGVRIINNIGFDTNYKVKLEAFGRKKNAFPTSFFRWRVVGRLQVKTNKYMGCNGAMEWWDNSVDPHYDGANCFVYDVPSGYNPFIYDGNYYISAPSPGNCPIGSWDTANCWLGRPPSGTTPFIYNNNFYYSE